MTTTAPKVDGFHDFWMPDYCPMCLARGWDRRATLTEPDAVTWYGGKALICEYRCDCCGHAWERPDLWTAANFGLEPVKRRTAA
ncbi:hypothetical protein [Mycobacterium avium]|uniref:hypothetical protein n=1 Tax=Mycobacterium avium TaxID=1764 RepID=UPI0009FD9886|nr:hypothetical protein [Mycobacterium avium]MDV3291916.1 hypothetical protein [Mycobacterium avium subsp. hominissuis]TXA41461.1 hypothetical protein DKM27_12995 [Mycobacterium tuberculosis variant bovis]